MDKTQKRVGVVGGVRIPFCRNNTAYADVGKFGMSVKVLGSLVEKFGLHGVELGEVAMGAVIRHSSDWNLAREARGQFGAVDQRERADAARSGQKCLPELVGGLADRAQDAEAGQHGATGVSYHIFARCSIRKGAGAFRARHKSPDCFSVNRSRSPVGRAMTDGPDSEAGKVQ